MREHVIEIAVLAGLLASLSAALEVGFRAGRRAVREHEEPSSPQVSAIQGALLGLLGLLLAFSFAAAGGRFLERQDLIVQEANAIGTTTLRADLLAEPFKTALREALQRYTEHRLAVTSQVARGLDSRQATEVERLQGEIWNAAIDGVNARPESMLSVLEPVNAVFDLHATRLAASSKHLPGLVLGLLIACSLLSMWVIGYGSGLGRRRSAPLSFSLVLLVTAALWITIDLDHPRAGWIRLSDAPLRGLKFGPP